MLDAGLKKADYFWILCSDHSAAVNTWCVFAYPDRGDKASILRSQQRYKWILKAAAVDYSEVEIWEVAAH